MTYSTLRLECRGPAAWIWMSRPEVHNAFDETLNVVRAIGERQSYRYFHTGERISAARAREIGLVHETVPPEELDAKVDEILAALLAGGPRAQSAATDLIRAVANRPIDDAVIEDTARRIATLRATDEARGGLRAFLDQPRPVWTDT